MSTKVLAGDLNVGDKFTWKGRTYEVMDVSEDFGVIHVTIVERSFPCSNYRPHRAPDSRHDWPACTCGHAAQEHN